MVKVKNKKRNLAEHTSNRKKMANTKTLNPFEIHINKEKMRVIGKKSKAERGLPGVTRSKAIKKRQRTLLQEYRVLNKSNKFTDRRIGEKNHQMSEDDRLTARFTAERVRAHKKKSIFNLADDEELTHRGQTLNEIEKFDDPRSDDEDSLDGRTGNLHKDFVEDVHFGGGILKRGDQDPVKTHKELIDQLIIESKKRKIEKQKAKEHTLELTEKLDTEWKDLIPIITANTKTKDDSAKDANDEYDKAVKELKFEARGTPSDRLKTEDELAKEEREKLEKLEKDRVERMRGFFPDETSTVKHRSADDLDDNFAFDSEPVQPIAYNEKGELIQQTPLVDQQPQPQEEEEQDDDNEVEDEQEEEEDEEEEEEEDNLSDLKEETSESEDESPQVEKLGESFKLDLLERKKIMDKARKELPFTFELPKSYEDLLSVLKNQSADNQTIIIERMIKCNHPSLAEDNKEKLSLLFVYLLQYINDLVIDLSLRQVFKVINCIFPQMYELAQLNSLNAHNCVLEVVKEKQNEYRKRPKKYPGFDVLIYAKLISCLFSTSDYQHKVVIPMTVFIDQMLQRCKVRCKQDISYGLFLVTLILEYTTMSKRYLPAAVNFLNGLIRMALPKTVQITPKLISPFRSNLQLSLTNDRKLHVKELKLTAEDLETDEIDEEYKIRVIFTSLCLLQEFHGNLRQNPSCMEIFQQTLNYLQLFPNKYLPNKVQSKLNELINDLKNAKAPISFIVMEQKRPKALRLYEPNIQKVYDERRHKVMSREKAEISKLKHKLKQEKKGALREIRRDNAFLSGVRIKQRITSDRERREKVKRIYGEASTQQSELNAFDRVKKRKK